MNISVPVDDWKSICTRTKRHNVLHVWGLIICMTFVGKDEQRVLYNAVTFYNNATKFLLARATPLIPNHFEKQLITWTKTVREMRP